MTTTVDDPNGFLLLAAKEGSLGFSTLPAKAEALHVLVTEGKECEKTLSPTLPSSTPPTSANAPAANRLYRKLARFDDACDKVSAASTGADTQPPVQAPQNPTTSPRSFVIRYRHCSGPLLFPPLEHRFQGASGQELKSKNETSRSTVDFLFHAVQNSTRVVTSLVSSLRNGTVASYIRLEGGAEPLSSALPAMKAMAVAKAEATAGQAMLGISGLKGGAAVAGKALMNASGAVTFEIGFGDLPLKSIAVSLAQSSAIPLVLGFLEGFFVEIVPDKWKGRVKVMFRVVNIILTCGGIALFLSDLFLTGGTVSLAVILLNVIAGVFCYFFGRFLGRWTAKGLVKLGSWIKAKWNSDDSDAPAGASQSEVASISIDALIQQNSIREGDFDPVPVTAYPSASSHTDSHAHGAAGLLHVGACTCCYSEVARVVFMSRNSNTSVCSHVAVCTECAKRLYLEDYLRCPVDKQEVLDCFTFPRHSPKEHDVRGCVECLKVGMCEHCDSRTRDTICWKLTTDSDGQPEFWGDVRYCHTCVEAGHVDTSAYNRVATIRPGGHHEAAVPNHAEHACN